MLATDFTLCGAGCALPRRCSLGSQQLDRVMRDSVSQVGGRIAVTTGQTVFQGGPVVSLYLF
jgi:hypothetical protein